MNAVCDRAALRGADVREALRGELPVERPKRRPAVRRRHRFLIAAVICGLLALACLYLAVTQ